MSSRRCAPCAQLVGQCTAGWAVHSRLGSAQLVGQCAAGEAVRSWGSSAQLGKQCAAGWTVRSWGAVCSWGSSAQLGKQCAAGEALRSRGAVRSWGSQYGAVNKEHPSPLPPLQAVAWRVTPGGRSLIDRRRRSRVERNVRLVVEHLELECGVPFGEPCWC